MKNEKANIGKTLGKTLSQDYLKFLDSYLPTTAIEQTERLCVREGEKKNKYSFFASFVFTLFEYDTFH